MKSFCTSKLFSQYVPIVVVLVLISAPLYLYFTHSAYASFTYVRAITLNTATYNPATESSFTVLVCANGSSPCNASVSGLNQSGGGAHVANANGYDIIFTSDSGCTTKLNWEVENYVASTGEMEAWVLIPSLGTSNQTIYMCYGNSGISTFQGGSTGSAWDSNYTNVYHLPNGSSLSLSDSTSNGNTATNHGSITATTGVVDGGASAPSTGSPDLTASSPALTSLTVSYWIKMWNNTNFTDGGFLVSDGTNSFRYFHGDNNVLVYTYINGSNVADCFNINTSDNNWHYVTVALNSTTLSCSLDGGAYSNYSVTFTGVGAGTVSFVGDNMGNYLYGLFDEARLSNVVRSANWVSTEYNNQSSPSTFETFGGENVISTTAVTNVNIRGGGSGKTTIRAGGSSGKVIFR